MISTLKYLSPGKSQKARTTYLNCPVCNLPMAHKNFVEISGIELDRCIGHGIWAEQEDLIQILGILVPGDIEILMEKASDYEKRKIERKIRSIEGKQHALSAELSRVRRFSRIHFALDFFGFG